jgi:hypothetical protein
MGAIVDGIDVVRYKADGSEESRTKIPVTYSPKEKWIRRITEDPTLDRKPAVLLPRIGYEMTGIMYAPERKVSNKRYFLITDESDANKRHLIYTPVPYDMTFNVYVQTKTQDEMFQVIEQVVPFFQPDYVVEMRGLQAPEVKWDIPITLDAIQTSDSYDGEIEDRRILVTTFEFIMKGYLFGPVRSVPIIKQVSVMTSAQLESNGTYISNIQVEPFIEGVALNDIVKEDPYEILVNYV